MDIQSEKLNLIQWIVGVNDVNIIKRFKALQKDSEIEINKTLTKEEKAAIDKGLQSIDEGRTHSHESVMKMTKKKYPNLFK